MLFLIVVSIELSCAIEAQRELQFESRRLSFWNKIDDIQSNTSNTPSSSPTFPPTLYPTTSPTSSPSVTASTNPSLLPSSIPSAFPTRFHSQHPSSEPTLKPSNIPSSSPSEIPSNSPSVEPSDIPTSSPTKFPTMNPTKSPTLNPTMSPTVRPSNFPTVIASSFPSNIASEQPSSSPSYIFPSSVPSMASEVFALELTLTLTRIRELTEQDDIEQFKNTTIQFASECTTKSIPKADIGDWMIDPLAQEMRGNLLEVRLMISAKVLSRHSDAIDSIVIQCFQNNYRELINRLESSLLQNGTNVATNNQGGDYLVILLTSAGIGILLIVLLLSLFMVRKQKNNNDKAKAIIRVRKLMKDFELACEPETPTSNTKYDYRKNAFSMPSVLQKINEHTSFHPDYEQDDHDEFLEESPRRIPQKIWNQYMEDDNFSRGTGMSSITDMNEYVSRPGLRSHQSSSIATSIAATSVASSTMLMGLNIPLQTAVAANRVPDRFVDNAKVPREDISPKITQETQTKASVSSSNIVRVRAALNDILLCMPNKS